MSSAAGSSVTFKSDSPFKRPSSTPRAVAPPSSSSHNPAQAPTLIPTSWLAPYEQRRLFFAIFGLIEVIKIWDIIAPYLTSNIEPTWSSAFRVRGWWTAGGWTVSEVLIFAAVSLLRIPMLSPSPKQLVQLSGLILLWNTVCWFVAEPGSFFTSIHLIGPAALGGEWYWSWWYSLRRWREPPHLEGRHMIRLRPFSTATLNPLSLSYCIPPDSTQPLYVPIVFNNSVPDEISYYSRSLSDGTHSTKTVAGSSLKRSSSHRPHLRIANSPAGSPVEDDEDPVVDPLSAVVLRAKANNEIAKLPSVKPADSLTLIPPDLLSTQSVLYLPVDKPSIIHLKHAIDKLGDRFHITPQKEAVIVECPSADETDQSGRLIKIGKSKTPSPEQRCVGEDEIIYFNARGAGTLKANWRKRSGEGQMISGTIEGIQDDSIASDEMSLIPRERITKTHSVPIRVVHDRPGQFAVSLTSITDSLHNNYVPGPASERIFNVLPRPMAKFDCKQSRELLVGQTTTLPLLLAGIGEQPSDLLYTFHPVDGSPEEKSIKVARRGEVIVVSQPGSYVLQSISGPCKGDIMEPSSCRVQLIPPPAVELSMTTLHECAMDVGVTVGFEFTGSAPFMVEYTEKRQNGKSINKSARFNGHTGEIVLQPDQEGQYTYTFNHLTDAKYKQVKLDKPPIEQTVHPLANVELLGPKKRKLFACSGNEVELEFEAKGADPLHLTYLESWAGKSRNTTIHIPARRQKIMVTLPPELSAERGGSGRYSVSLLSITDGNGCSRKLSVPTVDVDIDRQKPTARFANIDDVIMTEGESHRAALRLTGMAPWSILYDTDGGSPQRVSVHDPNGFLNLARKGRYRLLEVRDENCQGDISQTASSFNIDFKPRPSFSFQPSANVILDGQIWRHPGTCAGEEEDVPLLFSGQAPFELAYRYTSEGKTSRHSLKSAPSRASLQLSSEPGHHRYDFLEAKDLNYPSTRLSLVLEHDVYGRPSASFTKPNSRPMCLDGLLQGDAKIRLLGKAPFTLELGVRRPASSRLETFTLPLTSNEWTMDLPLTVKDAGRHEIHILSVSDASGCEQDVKDSDVRSTTMDVVESARIVPVTQVQDLCAGDTLDFLLQGKAPWTVEYEWLGKKHKVTSSSSQFSRYAEEPGTFIVKSVALKDNQCKREISDLKRRVHPLPSVKVQEGVAHLREGDDPASFSVTFEGTPPFSFTYTRSEMVGSRSKIVETQTVSDIMKFSYTISSTSPGDYEVVSVTDKYCRYPRVTRDGS
ncbi:hypothetical protein BD324DRAFT_631845 [Kockovaella imperatae]|uniref:Nucleoporin Pom152 n=1 Tax=Kockovaella imperatae TaxID=4999 RepID=A0A1Y1UDR3_9TREE|nr:hypothetical protein BD324DRAFT_631845 [Kockovaella imperatae]ORX35215.1 hypothetical protein BD324DRAFT_631845 [Kockovaella imperatae]